jgi:hypothetical protein
MARIRSIKPDFFLHEELSELSPLHRLFFIGLWTLADKEGKLEDRPRRIKAALFPYDETDVEPLLADLDAGGFILRYQADKKPCIYIPGFESHQRPHPKETSFKLPNPSPEALCREISRQAVKRSECIPSSPAGKEILDNGKEILDNIPEKASGLELVAEEEDSATRLQRHWNANAPESLPRIRALTPDRRRAIKARLKEHSVAEIEEAISSLGLSDFLCGGGDRGWKADFDWLVAPGNATKVLEGQYGIGAQKSSVAAGNSPPCNEEGCKRPGTRDFDGAPFCEDHYYHRYRLWIEQPAEVSA